MSHTTFKIIVFVFMAFIIYNLFRGLYFLVSGKEGGKGTARSLGWRIALSMALFLLLVIFKLTGLVEPHTLNKKSTLAAEEAVAPEKDEGKTLEQIRQDENPGDGRIRLKP